MSVVRRQGIKNTVYTYLGILLGILSTLYIQPFFLTKEQVGLTRLVITLCTILSSVACLGVTQVIVKFFPVFRDDSTKHKGFFSVALIFPLVGFLLLISVIYFFNDFILRFYGQNSEFIRLYRWPIIFGGLFNCFVFSFSAYCNAIQKSSISTLINEVLNRGILIFCILLFYFGFVSENEYCYLLAFIFFLQLLLLVIIIGKYDYLVLDLSFFSNNKNLSEIVRFGLIAAFIQITAITLKFADILFVGKYKSIEQLGVYSIAAFIGAVLETPLNAVEKIAGTKIAQHFAQGNLSEIEKMYRLSSKYLMVFCGFLGVILVTSIGPALSMLPGDYSSGTSVSIIICVGAFFNAATGVNYSILTYSNQYKLGAIFYFSLLVITCLLNIWLIPLHGIMGAAIATATASIIHNILRFAIIKLKLNMQPFTGDSWKILAIILISIAASYLMPISAPIITILVRVLVGSTIFLTLLIILKVFTIQEVKKELLSLKKTFF